MPHWKKLLLSGARTADALVERGLATAAEAPALQAVVERYELLVSDYYLSLIDPNDPADPIRRQALPDVAELDEAPGELTDPIGDRTHGVGRLLVHRYPDRALLFPTYRCPMFCRYCFRKVALNDEPIRLRADLDAALAYLAATPAIREVILSGGDPLMLSDERLDELLGALRAMPHIERLRLHTRFPVTLPMRVGSDTAAMLARHRPVWVVAHFNHPRELTDQARAAIDALVEAGVGVLNQAVLLRGVNDDAEILATLFGTLLRWQVRPYYLHHTDLTVGTRHFRVPLKRGLEIVRSLRGRTSGMAQPTYVLEIPGGGGKVPVDSGFVTERGDGEWHLRSPLTGEVTVYHEVLP